MRRKEVVIWRYGCWPWQRLIIVPDSLGRETLASCCGALRPERPSGLMGFTARPAL